MGFGQGPAILLAPVLVLLTLLTALGVGLWLSALNVQYRDVQHAVPFLLQLGLFISPVAYSVAIVPPGLTQVIYGLNPLAAIIQGFRWTLLGASPPGPEALLSLGVLLIVLTTGVFYFAGWSGSSRMSCA